jgi:hypothetical protein
MAKIYLLVNRVSYDYIKSVSQYIWLQINKNLSNSTQLLICDHVDSIDFEIGSVVFVIGDPFNSFEKKPNVKYVFLNFSVVLRLGSIFEFNYFAYRIISRKRKVLESKLGCFDYLLDYWPSQTIVLKNKLSKYKIHIDSFPVGIIPFQKEKIIPLDKRRYDVCFVGEMSPRRERLLSELKMLGIKISPTSGVCLEDVALDSRIVLNLHSRKSNHLEIPRILGAFATGSTLVSEHCYRMNDIFPLDTYVGCKYSDIPLRILKLLSDFESLDLVASRGYNWLEKDYLKRCDLEWEGIFERFK